MDAIITSPPETRARSRSKTPFTKGAEENGKDGRKSPNLQAITEDLETTATPAKSKRLSSQKAAQSSSQSATSSAATTTTTVIQTSTSSTTVSTRKSAGTASTSNGNNSSDTISPPPKKTISKELKDLENKRTREIKKSEINEKTVKKTITSTPKMSPNSSAVNFKLNSSHEDLDLEKHPAYKEYIEAGEYWNKYPKTDYTYSEASVDRREIGHGFVSMPNMSRKSLDRHVERVTTMIQNNPEQASYLRQRYQINPRTVSKTNKSFSLFSRNLLNYDSGDELDMSGFDRRGGARQEWVVKRTFIRIWTWITSIFSVFRRTTVTREQYRANYGQSRVALWTRIKTVSYRSGVWTKEMIVAFFKKIYLALATILYLDTLLVRQRSVTERVASETGAGDASAVIDGEEVMPKNKRRFLWILIILLPILLLAGWYSFCPQSTSSAASAWYGSSILTEKYERSLEMVRSLEVPPIGAYVREAGSKAGEQIVLMGTGALNVLGGFRWPSFNWTWVIGGGSTTNHYEGEKIIERVVHDWSKADASLMKDELRQELKIYVDALIGEKQKQLEKRSLSGEEVDNIMNLLLEKLRAGNYFKLDLTEENFRIIFLDMRERFLNDNKVFMEQLKVSFQGSLDLSVWEEKLEQFKIQLLGAKEDINVLRGDLDQAKKEMLREKDLTALKEMLMAYINEMIKQRVQEVVAMQLVNVNKAASGGSTLANEDEVRRLIMGALKVYDADKTGLSDYALESAGGQVLSTRCTENYHMKSAQISVFGIPLWYPSNTPRTAIQPNVLPGNCWAFQGFPGFLVLQLNLDIHVSGFTMEHIHKLLQIGKIESATKGFSVWGLDNENDQEPVRFGIYEYSDADDASSYQHFDVQNSEIDRKFRIVELRIESNHGHPNYTCLYRFRVHGSPI